VALSPERPKALPDASEFGLRELMAVREIVHAFLTAQHPEEVFQFALDRVTPLVGATLACVYLIDGDSALMRLAAAHHWPERYARFLGQMRVRLGAGPSGQAASERRAIEVPDVFADPSLGDWREVATELGFRSLVALPLQNGREVRGAVTFYFAGGGLVSADTRQLLRMVADQMAATADKARLIDELRRTNTALAESNAALERQNAELLEARRIKDEFLANISHELRTPLTAVIGYISIMQDGLAGPMTDEQQETLGQVKGASDQLLALIVSLLDLAAMKRGTVAVEVAELDPREPLRDAVAAVRTARAAAGRVSTVALDVSEPAAVPMMRSDRQAIARALAALLDNAFKFTHEGSVRVSLGVSDRRVRYAVEDTGIGISDEARQLVFEEFRQVDGTTTRRYGGSGLGLALARRIARLLHGDVTLDTAPGAGSTFTLDLPLEHGAGTTAPAVSPARRQENG
jgi:signal transduction histidine kinase